MSKKMLRPHLIIMVLVLFVAGTLNGEAVKNIIFMIPDGMGISNVTAARIYAFGTGSKRLHFETLEQIGYQSTCSSDSMVTDSAAAASAWACGEKFKNGEISFHGETQTYPRTILELARDKGKKTGLVATSTITHATPAAFGAHVVNRECEKEIASQYISNTHVDVLLGAGKEIFNSSETGADPCGTFGNFIRIAEQNGYTVVHTREEMIKSSGVSKLLGLFRYVSLTPAYRKHRIKKSAEEPSLAEMTQISLDILEKNPNGFFLMVEGSQIDWANHANNIEYQISEILEFDKAVKVVLDWLAQNPSRLNETLLVIIPDHDCGGFAVTGPEERIIEKPGEYVKAKWIWGHHTGEDTIIWSQGPYSKFLGKAIDNTDIFYIMRAALNGEAYNPNCRKSR
jgi:alkaline phosphatase